jgi:hypothetical protein
VNGGALRRGALRAARAAQAADPQLQQKRSATVEVEAAWGYTTPLLPENDKEWHTIGDGKRAIGMDGTPVLVRLVDRGTDVLHALKICKMPGCTSCTDGWAAARQKGFCCGRHQLEFERGPEFQAEIELLLAADSEGREQLTTVLPKAITDRQDGHRYLRLPDGYYKGPPAIFMWQFYAGKAVGKLNKCFDQPAGQSAQRFYQAVQASQESQ